MYPVPIRKVLPQEGVGGCTPSPRNDSAVSARMAAAIAKEVCTKSGPIMFGKTCCHEPQAGFRVREDPHDSRTALQFLVEALQAVGAADTTPV